MGIYFILWIIIQYYFILLLKLPQCWPWGALSLDSCVPLTQSHHRGLFFSFSEYYKYSKLILYISCPSPQISHIFKVPWSLLLENGIRIQHLDAYSLSSKKLKLYWVRTLT